MAATELPDLFGSDAGRQRSNYVHQLRQTIETYDVDLQVVLELVQNAIDAVARKDGGEVWVDIDVPAGRVTVRDNGVGFPPSEELLYLGGTDKGGDKKQKGKIGVGLKVVLFSSTRFLLESVSPQGRWRVEVVDAVGALALAGSDPSVRPAGTQELLPADPSIPTGTTVTVEFGGTEVLDWLRSAYEQVFVVQELTRQVETTCDILYANGQPYSSQAEALFDLYFQTAPYTGDVFALLAGGNDITLHFSIDVGAIDDQLTSNTIDEGLRQCLTGATYKRDISCTYADYNALLQPIPPAKFRTLRFQAPMPPGGLSERAQPDRLWFLKLTSVSEYESLITNQKGEVSPGFENLFDEINGMYLVLGDPVHLRRFIPGGPKRLISANGVLTAHVFPTPRGARHELYVPRIHFIVDVNADLNYGKRHLNNKHLVGQLFRYFNEAYARTLFEATRNLGSKVRVARDVKDRSYVSQPDLELPLPFVKEPFLEQDVIALFFTLLGSGYLEGLKVWGISSVDQYDGRFYARRDAGGRDPAFTTDDHLHKLEFKVVTSALCHDFDIDVKDPRDINLAVVWHNDSVDARYQVLDLKSSTTYSSRQHFPHVQHVLWDTTESHEIQLLVLEDLIKALAPPV